MPEQKSNEISRDRLAELLNEDLAREYQAIIAYVVYSQVLKGAEYMDIDENQSAKQNVVFATPTPSKVGFIVSPTCAQLDCASLGLHTAMTK
jgi:hypothetical protein